MTGERPGFAELIELRARWRHFHQKQDRENAEQAFRSAGVDRVTDDELEPFPIGFRQKLGDFGRDWERAIAAQGLRESYRFYRAQIVMAIDESNELQTALDEFFTPPLGAALFFESNGLHAVQDGVWDCLFYFVLHIEKDPVEIQFENFPGVTALPKILRIA
jgi:hypothetical protein